MEVVLCLVLQNGNVVGEEVVFVLLQYRAMVVVEEDDPSRFFFSATF